MKTLIPGTIADAADVNGNFNELAKRIDDAAPPVSPSSGRLGNPPAGKPLHVVAWSAAVRTNQYGQAVLDLPDGVAGLKDACVTCARFSTEDGNAYNEVAAVTGLDGARPIITITRGGVRAANLSTIVMVVGVGWKK